MDVKDALISGELKVNDLIDLTGWLVDTPDGLYILGDHSPEDYNYPYRIKILNENIIYPILRHVPSLAGGWSLLFHKTRIIGFLDKLKSFGVNAVEVFVERDRDSGNLQSIDIEPETIKWFIEQYGYYKFDRPRNPMRDWTSDV